MNLKEKYTRVFLKEMGLAISEASIAEYMPLWWKNTRNKSKGGLRLTEIGFDTINEIGIATYDVPYPKEMSLTTQVIIFLDQFIDCPYYLTNRSITVTNEKKAIELSLFSGDLRKYGIIKAMKRQENS